MDKINVLFGAYNFVMMFNPKMYATIVWIFEDGNVVYATICGRDARKASNAIYHALRAAGRRRVQRTTTEKRGCWLVSYV
jgi:hypothetical protein